MNEKNGIGMLVCINWNGQIETDRQLLPVFQICPIGFDCRDVQVEMCLEESLKSFLNQKNQNFWKETPHIFQKTNLDSNGTLCNYYEFSEKLSIPSDSFTAGGLFEIQMMLNFKEITEFASVKRKLKTRISFEVPRKELNGPKEVFIHLKDQAIFNLDELNLSNFQNVHIEMSNAAILNQHKSFLCKDQENKNEKLKGSQSSPIQETTHIFLPLTMDTSSIRDLNAIVPTTTTLVLQAKIGASTKKFFVYAKDSIIIGRQAKQNVRPDLEYRFWEQYNQPMSPEDSCFPEYILSCFISRIHAVLTFNENELLVTSKSRFPLTWNGWYLNENDSCSIPWEKLRENKSASLIFNNFAGLKFIPFPQNSNNVSNDESPSVLKIIRNREWFCDLKESGHPDIQAGIRCNPFAACWVEDPLAEKEEYFCLLDSMSIGSSTTCALQLHENSVAKIAAELVYRENRFLFYNRQPEHIFLSIPGREPKTTLLEDAGIPLVPGMKFAIGNVEFEVLR